MQTCRCTIQEEQGPIEKLAKPFHTNLVFWLPYWPLLRAPSFGRIAWHHGKTVRIFWHILVLLETKPIIIRGWLSEFDRSSLVLPYPHRNKRQTRTPGVQIKHWWCVCLTNKQRRNRPGERTKSGRNRRNVGALVSWRNTRTTSNGASTGAYWVLSDTFNQSMLSLVTLFVSLLAHPIDQSINLSINLSINQSINQSMTLLVILFMSLLTHSINQWYHELYLLAHSINQSINQASNEWMNQWSNQSINQSNKQGSKEAMALLVMSFISLLTHSINQWDYYSYRYWHIQSMNERINQSFISQLIGVLTQWFAFVSDTQSPSLTLTLTLNPNP